MIQPPQAPPRQRIPKDGPGPRGGVDCYYTSRVLDSTYRYVKFVKKLRATEDEQRRGNEIKLQELKDIQNSDFFIRCDRKALINNVSRRVDLCMAAYEEDLKQKRTRLMDLLKHEEEENIRKFVVQAQAGAEQIWQEKLERLNYLLAKRKKEHEDRFKDTPLSKCTHVLPCIVKLRAKEAEEIQLYQIKEKESRKKAELEFDKMWYEMAMRESDALAARMEVDTIERLRRDQECLKYTEQQLAQRKIQKEKEREFLKEEAKWFRAMWDEDIRKEREKEAQMAEKRKATAAERKQMIEDSHAAQAKQAKEAKMIADTWDSLAGQGLADELAKVEYMRKKERDLDACNKHLLTLKAQFAELESATEAATAVDMQAQRQLTDERMCRYIGWAQKTNRDVRKAMIAQIKDRKDAKEALQKKLAEQDEYQSQVFAQMEQLCAHKELTDAINRKEKQRQLLEQIEYNKLLKERALQEEMEQRKKAKIATEEYQQEIAAMLARPFYSDEVHPFMKQMAQGLKMKEKCPCSKPDYCK